MKLLVYIFAAITVLVLGFGIYAVHSVANAGQIMGGLFGLIIVVAIVAAVIFGATRFVSDRNRGNELFKLLLVSFWGVLLVLLSVFAIFGHGVINQILGFKSHKNIATVSAEPAKTETWQPDFTSVGNLDPVQGADISNQVAGNVTAINFDSGQEVQKGQLLVQLDASNEEAQLEGFKAQEKLAELNDQRSHDIFAKHLISQSDVDTADANLKQAQANVANTEADIAKKTIRAPFAGHAGIRNVNLGQYLPQGTALVTLQALDHMYVSFALPEQALPSLANGQKVQATVDAIPNETFNGSIDAIDSKVDPTSHNVRVQAILANPQHHLRAGMFANVTVSAGKPQQVVTVPKAAITYSLYGNSVFVVAPDDKNKDDKGQPQLTANEVFVKLGPEQGARVSVLQGLKAGDQVVTSGMQKLHSGAVVVINNDVPPEQGQDQIPGASGK